MKLFWSIPFDSTMRFLWSFGAQLKKKLPKTATYWVYDELTIDHLSMCLDSSVDRAFHRYRKVMGSSPVQA